MSKIRNNEQGFTLIELVAVIVILGVLALATVRFIGFGTQIYYEANNRQLVLSQSRFAIERMTREIRSAIPNSIRVSADNRCIEFVPIKASGAYRDDVEAELAPISPESSSNMDVMGWLGAYETDDKLYIYPTEYAHIYDELSQRKAVLGDPDGAGALPFTGTAPELNITFASVAEFEEHSPKRRYYTADHSISYCFITNTINYDLYRFTEDEFTEDDYINDQTVPITKAQVLNISGVLMAERLTNDFSDSNRLPFSFNSPTLQRNSVVNLYLEFQANTDENMFFNHEVHIPNVP